MTSYAEKLVFATEIIRHGERTPHIDLPHMPNDWEQGVGQLTDRGIEQQRELGYNARKIYINQYKLLDKRCNTNQVYVRSSGYDRTKMSAEAYISGMFASCSNVKSLTIDSQAIADDNLLIGYDIHKQHILEHAKQNPKLQEYHRLLTQKYENIIKRTNIPVKSLYDLAHIGDALFIRKQMQKTLPDGITHREIDDLYHELRYVIAATIEQRELGAIAAYELVTDIYQKMTLVSTKDSKAKKFVLYSGHDVTLLALLSALGAPLKKNPPYASKLSILLFEQDDDNKSSNYNYHIKLAFNNQPISLSSCKQKFSCSLTEFEHIVRDINQLAIKHT